ncbi:MAG: hypothetical protein H5U40_19300 [Polyangiaceae bacterium]|nr:hypothetical protein [Polyangiaceae bacterium]
MTAPQRIYVALVLLSSLWAFVHLVLVVRTFRDGVRGALEKIALLFPPTAPVVAIRRGERALVFAWVLLLSGYLVVLFTQAI